MYASRAVTHVAGESGHLLHGCRRRRNSPGIAQVTHTALHQPSRPAVPGLHGRNSTLERPGAAAIGMRAAQAPKVQTRWCGATLRQKDRGAENPACSGRFPLPCRHSVTLAMPPHRIPSMSAPLKRTPLAAAHVAAGARMVDFGGWEMPLAYGSQLEEHHAVRRDAGMFDVSHMLNADVTGPDARAFLRRLVANDVARLAAPGKALYTCMLNPEGGIIDDLIVYFFADEEWRVVVNAATADKDIAWMQRVAAAGRFDVAIAPRRDLAMIAVQGPNARAKVWAARPGWQGATEPLTPFVAAQVDDDALVARTGYTGEDGFEIVVPAAQAEALWNDLAAQGVRPCGLGARDTLRLEAGMNLYGQDMDEL